jgi:hypothetical protein
MIFAGGCDVEQLSLRWLFEEFRSFALDLDLGQNVILPIAENAVVVAALRR